LALSAHSIRRLCWVSELVNMSHLAVFFYISFNIGWKDSQKTTLFSLISKKTLPLDYPWVSVVAKPHSPWVGSGGSWLSLFIGC